MSKKVISEAAHISEFERIIERLTFIIEAENHAIDKGHIHVLQEMQEEKSRLTYFFQKKWAQYSPRLKKRDTKRVDAFSSLTLSLETLKDVMRKNQVLLNAAKINSANRIEAGMHAWQKHQSATANSYGMDGTADPYKTGPNVTTSRLI